MTVPAAGTYQITNNATGQAQTFQTGLHPRGSDGKFITLGGRVQTTGPNGKPNAEGTVQNVKTDAHGNTIATVQMNDGSIQMVPTGSLSQAPTAKATLNAAGAIPVSPASAAALAKRDAKAGLPVRTATDTMGNKTPPAAVAAYQAAYTAEQKVLAAQAAINAKKGIISAPNSAQVAKMRGTKGSIKMNNGSASISGTIGPVVGVGASAYYTVSTGTAPHIVVQKVLVSNTKSITPSTVSTKAKAATGKKAGAAAKAASKAGAYKQIRSQQRQSLAKFTKAK